MSQAPCRLRLVLLLGLLVSVSGCLGPIRALYPPESLAVSKSVYLVQHGWHTRIAVRRHDVSAAIWPEVNDLGDVTWIEVGWGNAAYYQADDPTVAQAINAVIHPTPSALHVGGFDAPIREFLPGLTIVRVDLSPTGFDRLTRFIHESYAHDDQGNPLPTKPGRYPRSSYYLATGKYHAFNTSNNWTARALRAAGTPITPAYAMLASNVVCQARRFGTVLQ
jgi:uncharacterized protein (TIGR02117 family)